MRRGGVAWACWGERVDETPMRADTLSRLSSSNAITSPASAVISNLTCSAVLEGTDPWRMVFLSQTQIRHPLLYPPLLHLRQRLFPRKCCRRPRRCAEVISI